MHGRIYLHMQFIKAFHLISGWSYHMHICMVANEPQLQEHDSGYTYPPMNGIVLGADKRITHWPIWSIPLAWYISRDTYWLIILGSLSPSIYNRSILCVWESEWVWRNIQSQSGSFNQAIQLSHHEFIYQSMTPTSILWFSTRKKWDVHLDLVGVSNWGEGEGWFDSFPLCGDWIMMRSRRDSFIVTR